MTSNVGNSQGVVFHGEIHNVTPPKILSTESKIVKDLWKKVADVKIDIRNIQSYWRRGEHGYEGRVKELQSSCAEIKEICDIIRSAGAIALEIEIELVDLKKNINKLA